MTSFLRNRPKTVLALGAFIIFVSLTATFQKSSQRPFNPHDVQGGWRGDQPQGELPVTMNDMFMGSGRCAGCHGIDQAVNPIANVTSEGENVSPAENWRGTMMANSAKDPMWRAKVAHEIAMNPNHEDLIVNTCTRCHAPLGRFEAEHDGIENFTLEMLDSDSLARDGVSCMACHAQQINTVGTTFSGDLHFNSDTVWGPQFNIPQGDFPLFNSAMQSFVGVDPVPTTKFFESEVCATCHTLQTHTLDFDQNPTGNVFVEQATYHEWVNSAYNNDVNYQKECQGCHMPNTDEPIIVASGYAFLPPRQPYGQHWLVGGNSFMIELLRDNILDLGLTANENHFNTVLNRTMQNLQENSAMIELVENGVDGDTARYTVKLTNKAGHKLPSGYPARRAYVDFAMYDEDGNEIFHSGKLLPDYNIEGQDDTFEPHYDVITNENQIQIYEMVMGDVNGNVTTVLERADIPLKDNRLVPLGFSTEHYAYDTTAIVGPALNDPNFNHVNGIEGSGTDEIQYHVPVTGINGNVTVVARFMYQSLPPRWNEELFAVDHPAINSFEEMYWETAPDPVEMVSASVNSTLIEVKEYANFFRTGPNPTTTGWVNIDAGKDIIKKINVYDLQGKLIESYAPNSSRSQAQLPKAVGTYLLDVTTSRGRRIEKVLRR
ncbi:MAG: T9SS type A sorting domain-containing protein [Flavobacteriales bacterium]|nr:T9SS type A sorting domain-containing protein [Flavobacteriales bacterium]